MTANLGRFAGKVIYPTGGSVPLHVMPLFDFHLDAALDTATIVSLRSARQLGKDGVLDEPALFAWRQRMALDEIVDLMREGLTAMKSPMPRILEIGGESGLVYERLKHDISADGGAFDFAYTIEGNAAAAPYLEALHGAESHVPMFVDRSRAISIDSDLIVLNHLHGIRRFDWTGDDFERDFVRVKGEAVLALQVSLGDAFTATTVRGHRVVLPSIRGVISRLPAAAGSTARLVRDFDKDFFLPELPDRTGLFLCRLGPTSRHRPGYREVASIDV